MMGWLLILLILLLAAPAMAAAPSTVAPTLSLQITATASPHTVTLPSCAAGRWLLFISDWDGAASPTWPTGTGQTTNQIAIISSNIVLEVRARITDGSEPASLSVTPGATVSSGHWVYCVTDGDLATPPEAALYNAGTTATPDPPTLTTGWPDADATLWFVAAGLNTGTPTLTSCPTNYTTNCQESGSFGARLNTSWRSAVATAENPGVFTYSSAPFMAIVATIGVRPASAAGCARRLLLMGVGC